MSRRSPLLEAAALPLYWVLLLGAVWVLLRGHNAPGGGFIGGLLAVAASSWLAIAREVGLARSLQPMAPLKLAVSGVGLAFVSGVAGLVLGRPFLSHLWAGSVSTVMLFDLGVFLAVWGGLTGFIYPLLEEEQA